MRAYADGRPLRVGARIGRGGEGDVHRIDDGSGRALKVYHRPDAAREAKVAAMIGADLAAACPAVAFPRSVAVGADGRFVGFTMPMATGSRPVPELYGPASRRRLFPAADFRFLVRAAANLARAVARVHAAGVVMGDLNQSGVLVARDALVTLIDADSFQFGPHGCRVGMPDYTAPEIQGRDLGGVVRRPQHDLFALAVLVFQLLFLGRHPAAGVGRGRDVPLLEAIRTRCFAFSLVREGRLTPPPAVPSLADLPSGVRAGFEAAFGAGLGPRLTAAEWVVELAELEARLVPCGRDPRHHHLDAARACPWCAIERVTRSRVFGTGSVVAAAARAAPVEPSPIRDRAKQSMMRATWLLLIRASSAPVGDPVQPSAAVRRYRAETGSARIAALARRLAAASGPGSTNRFMARLAHAEARAGEAAAAQRIAAELPLLTTCAAEARAALDALDAMPGGGAAAFAREARAELEGRVLERMRMVGVATASFPGLAARHRAALAAMGGWSAADVDRARLASVPGLGAPAIAALLVWRDRVAARIGREVGRVPASGAGVLAGRASSRRATTAAALERAVRRLEAQHARSIALIRAPSPECDSAAAARAQAIADLRYLGFPVRTGARSGSPTGGGRSRAPAKACPDCGGALVRRWAGSGAPVGGYALGCSAYPACTGSRPVRARRRP